MTESESMARAESGRTMKAGSARVAKAESESVASANSARVAKAKSESAARAEDESTAAGRTSHKTVPAVTFRPMRKEDAEAAARIEAASSQEPWSQQSYADAVCNENAYYLAAELEGCVIGCCGLWQSFEEADICNVVVEEGFRRRRIAEEMLTALMEAGKKRGVLHFTLEVRKGNTAAVRLYEKLGFITEGVRRGFYQNPKEDALIMWKRQETHGET